MSDPVAVITITGTSEISYASLPATRTLSGATSTWGTGTGVTPTYQWYILDKPVGSAAAFSSDTVVSPTFGPIDLPGTYRVFLVVENDQSDSSFASPVPQQSASAPYGFSLPPASAFFEIRALTRYAGLKKVAYGERDWLEDGLWPIVDKVDEHEMKVSQMYVSEGVIKANSILEYTAGNGVTVDGVLLKDGDVKVATSSDAVYTNVIIAGSAGGGSSSLAVYATPLQVLGSQSIGGTLAVNTINEFTTNSGVTIEGVLLKDNGITIGDAYAIDSTGGSASMLINGTADQIDFSAFNGVRFLSGTEVVTDWIEAITTDEPVTVRGNGASPSDLDVDVVRADTNNGGVTILGKGTHTYDLLAESIKTDSIQSDSVGALAIGNTVGAVQITAAGNITLTSGTAIQTATLKTNLGSSITYKSAPITLASAYPNTSTTGLVAETLWTTNIPANTLSTNGSSITGEVYFTTAANNHSKTARIKFDGTTVSTRATSVNNGWLRSTFTIMRTGSSTQISFAETIDSSSVHGVNGMTTMSVTDTAAIPLIIEGETGAGIGDITVRTVILKYNRGEAAL